MAADIPHAATHSSLDIFQKPSILVNFESGNVQEIYPVGSLDGPNLEFTIQSDRHVFLDLQNVFLDLTFNILKKKGDKLDADDTLYLVNNSLHSLFSNCDVSVNNTLVYTSNGHYPHKCMIQAEVSHTRSTKDSILECQGYSYEDDPSDLTSAVFTERKTKTDTSSEVHLFGKLGVDFFNCDKLLIPNTDIRITLIKSNPNFCLISTTPDDKTSKLSNNYTVKYIRASLHVRQMNVSESVHRSINSALARGPARYTFPDFQTKTFIIPATQNQFIRENIFNNEPIRRIAIAMNTNADFTGSLATNPFNYQKFGLREIKIFRNGQPLIVCNTQQNVRPYYHTLTSLNFQQDGPGIPLRDYGHHFIMVFDLTATQQSDTEIYYPEVVGAGIRLELFFDKALANTLEIILLGEKLSTVYIHNDGKVIKDG